MLPENLRLLQVCRVFQRGGCNVCRQNDEEDLSPFLRNTQTALESRKSTRSSVPPFLFPFPQLFPKRIPIFLLPFTYLLSRDQRMERYGRTPHSQTGTIDVGEKREVVSFLRCSSLSHSRLLSPGSTILVPLLLEVIPDWKLSRTCCCAVI